jgi:integrase
MHHTAAFRPAFPAHPHTEPISKRGILKRYGKALEAAQLGESHVFHDLRHTFGTRMAAAGVPPRTLQEWMGHRRTRDDAEVRGLRA